MPIIYNRDMTNTNTKENDMKSVGNLGRYQGKAVFVLKVSEYWNEALVRYIYPEAEPEYSGKSEVGVTKWRRERWFRIGLPQLKEF